MKFFDNAAEFIDNLISDYITGEILLLGIVSIILIVFLTLIVIHLFSKDIIAKRKLGQINRLLKTKKYDPSLDMIIARKFKTAPFHFFENYQNGVNSMTFSNCIPYYESSKSFGKRFFAVFSIVICLLVSAAALILTDNNIIIYLSNALLIPIAGLIFALILQSIYAYIKGKTYKKLNYKFDEFIKLSKPKIAAYNSSKKFSESIMQAAKAAEEDVMFNEAENFEELMERIKEVKVKGATLEKMKDLANDLAVEREKVKSEDKKEGLTEALTDLLNIINKTA